MVVEFEYDDDEDNEDIEKIALVAERVLSVEGKRVVVFEYGDDETDVGNERDALVVLLLD